MFSPSIPAVAFANTHGAITATVRQNRRLGHRRSAPSPDAGRLRFGCPARRCSSAARCWGLGAAGISQTPRRLSQHVTALEREIGLPLIVRGTRPVELTEAGYALVRHATGIFARLDGTEQELSEIAGRRHGRLRFGSFPTALATLAPPAFARFRRRHPDVTLTVVDDHLQRLIPRLQAGELDLALIYDHEALSDITARDLERTALFDDVFRAILPAGHRLSRRRRPLELFDLAGEPWIGGTPTSAWYRITSSACSLAGFTPQAAFAFDDPIAIQALVAAGLGVSDEEGHATPPAPRRTASTVPRKARRRRRNHARMTQALCLRRAGPRKVRRWPRVPSPAQRDLAEREATASSPG
jgi:DNA-binding transcriptional LysR family regulator